jgi:hypothetical protein
VAAGIGWSWGTGTLTLRDGWEHRFKVSGLDVSAVRIKQATGVGHVYHLKQLGDFEGKYVEGAGYNLLFLSGRRLCVAIWQTRD